MGSLARATINLSKKADVLTAIDRVCDAKYFLFKKESIPPEFIEFTEQKASRFKRGLYFKKCTGFHDFTYNYNDRLKLRHIEQVDTEFVAMGWKTIKDFYGSKVINASYYGIKHYVNRKRLSDIATIPIDRVQDIIDVASAGLWELLHHDKFGFAIKQNTLFIDTPINVLTHNQWVMHNIGLISKLNSMYYQATE